MYFANYFVLTLLLGVDVAGYLADGSSSAVATPAKLSAARLRPRLRFCAFDLGLWVPNAPGVCGLKVRVLGLGGFKASGV